MRAKPPFLASIIALVLLIGGCDRSGTAAQAPETAPAAIAPMQVIRLSDWPAVRQQYQGKILVADLWASWCVSCIERFPAMVELSRRYRQQAVQFISLNLDDPSDAAALAWSDNFLQKMQADFPHYHLNENMMESFEQLDLLGIPVVLVFDQTGRERYRLTGDNPNKQFGDDDVENAIKTLLESSG